MRRIKLTDKGTDRSFEGWFHGVGVVAATSGNAGKAVVFVETDDGRLLTEDTNWYKVEFLSPPEDSSWVKKVETVLWEINSNLIKVWGGEGRLG